MLAGLDYVQGQCDAVVLIDSDLQHPPELIENMIEAWEEGAEIVTAIRNQKDEESIFKVTTAAWFYKVFNKLVDSIVNSMEDASISLIDLLVKNK